MMSDAQDFKSAMADALKKSRVANGVADDAPMGAALLGSVGGIRGIIESALPTLLFVVLRLFFPSDAVTDIAIATLVPVAIAVIFVIARSVSKSPASPAVTGAILLGITALLAIVTKNASNNFLPGLLLNSAFLLAFVVSIAVRRPLVGVLVALLLGEKAEHWRDVRAQFRALTIATLVWTAMYALRLAVELPLYFAGNDAALGVAKLVLGVPLYAVVLLLTWLLIRSVFPPKPAEAQSAPEKLS